jgi:apolipoprotein D and lipocalin family protein
MARERMPRGEVLQAAYGVLDKYKMNRAFFVRTDQGTCETLAPPQEAIDSLSPAPIVKVDADVQKSDEQSINEIPIEIDPVSVNATTTKP